MEQNLQIPGHNESSITPKSQSYQLFRERIKIKQQPSPSLEEISYRPIKTIDDVEQLKILFKEWFPISYPDQFYEELLEEYTTFHSLLAVYRTEHNGQTVEIILGCIIYDFRSVQDILVTAPARNSLFKQYKSLYLCALGVVSEMRKKGLATILVQTILKQAKQNDQSIKIVYLDVISYNEIAMNFYKKNGFIKTHVKKEYYEINDQIYDSFVYCFFTEETIEQQQQNVLMKFNYVWNMSFTLLSVCRLAKPTDNKVVSV